MSTDDDSVSDCMWSVEEIPPSTRCKHGKGDCETCGTSNRRDVIHRARTPNKREMRRQKRREGK